jgi:tetratricopeptide (TPR) repeat protein
MSKESVVFAVAGAFFGLIVGWILGSQQTPPRTSQAAVATAQAPAPGQQQAAAAPPFDDTRARALELRAQQSPTDPVVRAELGNLYFDGERYEQAIRWYEDSLKLDPRNVDVSTDLGVSYYYTNQPDRALSQFDRSLAINPKHTKTILNQGIVRAFGKQDLAGAAEAWQKVIALAPESPEARAARQALESMKAAHPGVS